MAIVLVIERDDEARVALANALRRVGHSALVASTARAGVQMAQAGGADAIILDWSLPDLAGEPVVAALRAAPMSAAVPILIVSGLASEPDRVRGLEAGAEDYVIKPYSTRELLLRLQVALRRRAELGPPGRIVRAALEIDAHQQRATLGGILLPLTPIEFRLLTALAARPDRVLTRQALLAEVWGVQPDLETRTVDTHIRRLREKLGPRAALVETVRGVGYRLRDLDGRPARSAS